MRIVALVILGEGDWRIYIVSRTYFPVKAYFVNVLALSPSFELYLHRCTAVNLGYLYPTMALPSLDDNPTAPIHARCMQHEASFSPGAS